MKNLILDFLKKTGREAEFKLFLDTIHHTQREKFALLKVSGKILEEKQTILINDIAYLNQLDIYPMLVHGAGSRLDTALPHSQKIDGYRVTSKEDMYIIDYIFQEIASELVTQIEQAGGRARHMPPLFTCRLLPRLEMVGEILEVNTEPILQALRDNCTPIISPIGLVDGQKVNINADTAAKAVVAALKTRKFILLTESGGILDPHQRIIPSINLSSPGDISFITGGMKLKLNEIESFLKDHSYCEVVITSPENLLKEIFTIKGHGTFIKYFQIHKTDHWEGIDLEKVRDLLETSFRKKLVEGYFNRLVKSIYYQQDYEGIAIVSDLEGLNYLDKIAVSQLRQGTGLGKSIWENIVADYPQLIWRAALNNPINPFYMQHCDGMVKGKEWIVYWKEYDFKEIIPAMKIVSAKERTLI